MHKYKQYTRLFVFSIIAFIFLFPIKCEHSINIDKGNYNRKYKPEERFHPALYF